MTVVNVWGVNESNIQQKWHSLNPIALHFGIDDWHSLLCFDSIWLNWKLWWTLEWWNGAKCSHSSHHVSILGIRQVLQPMNNVSILFSFFFRHFFAAERNNREKKKRWNDRRQSMDAMPSWKLKHTEEESPFTFDEIASLSNDGNYQVFLVSRVAHTTTQSLFCHCAHAHHSWMVRRKTLSYLVLSAYRWICCLFLLLTSFHFIYHYIYALLVITQVR